DEGTTTFNENQAKKDFYPGRNWDLPEQAGYLQVVRAGEEGEMMRRSAYHYTPFAYGVASYDKPATVLAALRGVLGDSVFLRGLREYAQRWKYKHPYPWDLWNTFEHVSGKDLDWFWYPWYYTTWTLDQAVATVTSGAGGTIITVEDRGRVPMPVHVAITREGGPVEQRVIPVDVWLTGVTQTTITVTGAPVTRVEIDPERKFPDLNRANNVWTR
ncbi:MAG TPA: M1 family aminopeptidase, partial [Longimicrobiales bacterium]|nr:M1 family aminopeptidase [Longimicrobiales bacterium]